MNSPSVCSISLFRSLSVIYPDFEHQNEFVTLKVLDQFLDEVYTKINTYLRNYRLIIPGDWLVSALVYSPFKRVPEAPSNNFLASTQMLASASSMDNSSTFELKNSTYKLTT